jgi:hydrogenase maturation protease
VTSGLLVVGLGNAWRRDDGAGPAVARALGDDPRVLVHEGEPIALLDAWAGAAEVMVIDAVSSGAPAGTAHRLDAAAKPRPATVARGSTHALGLAETIEHARTLDRPPPQLMVYGIEEEDFRAGDEFTAPARAAVGAVRLELRERLVTS